MEVISRHPRQLSIVTTCTLLVLILSLVFALFSRGPTRAAGEELTQISSDPYTNNSSFHKTEVEPDTFAFGNTVVSTFQVSRFYDGGAANIGWATSTNAGETWTHGFLPGITVFAGGPYNRASDPSVAYDARHKAWIISYLAIVTGGHPVGPIHTDLLASRSPDGLHWSTPVIISLGGPSTFYDKNWSVCDDWTSSPFYGHCYTEWDNAGANNLVLMSTSKDGGKTWGPPTTNANHASVIGGQPVVQPNGNVVVPIIQFKQHFTIAILASFRSTDGGASWSSTVKIADFITFFEPSFIRNPDLPSAEVDASGRVYVAWYDCRFEPGCNANDIVISTSTDGLSWTAPKRVPIDPIGSGIDHFTPGIGVDRSTSSDNAHIGLTYYYYPNPNCSTNTCILDVGFISSTNGGDSWSASEQLAGPMKLTWLALTTQGYMYGDYISTSIVPGDDDATPVFMVAQQPTGGPRCSLQDGVICHEAAYTTPEDLLQMVGGSNTAGNASAAQSSSQKVHVTQTGF